MKGNPDIDHSRESFSNAPPPVYTLLSTRPFFSTGLALAFTGLGFRRAMRSSFGFKPTFLPLPRGQEHLFVTDQWRRLPTVLWAKRWIDVPPWLAVSHVAFRSKSRHGPVPAADVVFFATPSLRANARKAVQNVVRKTVRREGQLFRVPVPSPPHALAAVLHDHHALKAYLSSLSSRTSWDPSTSGIVHSILHRLPPSAYLAPTGRDGVLLSVLGSERETAWGVVTGLVKGGHDDQPRQLVRGLMADEMRLAPGYMDKPRRSAGSIIASSTGKVAEIDSTSTTDINTTSTTTTTAIQSTTGSALNPPPVDASQIPIRMSPSSPPPTASRSTRTVTPLVPTTGPTTTIKSTSTRKAKEESTVEGFVVENGPPSRPSYLESPNVDRSLRFDLPFTPSTSAVALAAPPPAAVLLARVPRLPVSRMTSVLRRIRTALPAPDRRHIRVAARHAGPYSYLWATSPLLPTLLDTTSENTRAVLAAHVSNQDQIVIFPTSKGDPDRLGLFRIRTAFRWPKDLDVYLLVWIRDTLATRHPSLGLTRLTVHTSQPSEDRGGDESDGGGYVSLGCVVQEYIAHADDHEASGSRVSRVVEDALRVVTQPVTLVIPHDGLRRQLGGSPTEASWTAVRRALSRVMDDVLATYYGWEERGIRGTSHHFHLEDHNDRHHHYFQERQHPPVRLEVVSFEPRVEGDPQTTPTLAVRVTALDESDRRTAVEVIRRRLGTLFDDHDTHPGKTTTSTPAAVTSVPIPIPIACSMGPGLLRAARVHGHVAALEQLGRKLPTAWGVRIIADVRTGRVVVRAVDAECARQAAAAVVPLVRQLEDVRYITAPLSDLIPPGIPPDRTGTETKRSRLSHSTPLTSSTSATTSPFHVALALLTDDERTTLLAQGALLSPHVDPWRRRVGWEVRAPADALGTAVSAVLAGLRRMVPGGDANATVEEDSGTEHRQTRHDSSPDAGSGHLRNHGHGPLEDVLRPPGPAPRWREGLGDDEWDSDERESPEEWVAHEDDVEMATYASVESLNIATRRVLVPIPPRALSAWHQHPTALVELQAGLPGGWAVIMRDDASFTLWLTEDGNAAVATQVVHRMVFDITGLDADVDEDEEGDEKENLDIEEGTEVYRSGNGQGSSRSGAQGRDLDEPTHAKRRVRCNSGNACLPGLRWTDIETRSVAWSPTMTAWLGTPPWRATLRVLLRAAGACAVGCRIVGPELVLIGPRVQVKAAQQALRPLGISIMANILCTRRERYDETQERAQQWTSLFSWGDTDVSFERATYFFPASHEVVAGPTDGISFLARVWRHLDRLGVTTTVAESQDYHGEGAGEGEDPRAAPASRIMEGYHAGSVSHIALMTGPGGTQLCITALYENMGAITAALREILGEGLDHYRLPGDPYLLSPTKAGGNCPGCEPQDLSEGGGRSPPSTCDEPKTSHIPGSEDAWAESITILGRRLSAIYSETTPTHPPSLLSTFMSHGTPHDYLSLRCPEPQPLSIPLRGGGTAHLPRTDVVETALALVVLHAALTDGVDGIRPEVPLVERVVGLVAQLVGAGDVAHASRVVGVLDHAVADIRRQHDHGEGVGPPTVRLFDYGTHVGLWRGRIFTSQDMTRAATVLEIVGRRVERTRYGREVDPSMCYM